jgi:hypothetical protein
MAGINSDHRSYCTLYIVHINILVVWQIFKSKNTCLSMSTECLFTYINISRLSHNTFLAHCPHLSRLVLNISISLLYSSLAVSHPKWRGDCHRRGEGFSGLNTKPDTDGQPYPTILYTSQGFQINFSDWMRLITRERAYPAIQCICAFEPYLFTNCCLVKWLFDFYLFIYLTFYRSPYRLLKYL